MESQNPRSDSDAHMILRDQFQPVISLNNVQTQRDTNEEDSTCADSSSSSSSTSSPDAAAAPEFSFSSDSSSDDFIQVDNPILIFPKPSTTEIQLEEEDERVVSNLSQLKLEEIFLRSSSTNSRISDVTIESYIPDVSTTQSPPPLQLMGKTTDFDPERIPASIFGKPSSPLDWSAASNESLFSIHIGNYSFSHDLVESTESGYSLKEMYNKSGELTNSNDISNVKNDSQNTVPRKAKILDEALVNIPQKSVNDDGFLKQGGFEDKRDNCKGTDVKLQSCPHPIKGSRYCCCSKPECCCEWLTCQSCCSCNNRLFSCWPKCCCSPSKWKCLKWWNLCSCFSSCCSGSFCSFRKIFCCFSYRRSRNLQQSNKASKQDTNNNYCRCCFSYPCCCS